jgi:hypothetical protein
MAKFIVVMTATTKVAALIEAKDESRAAEVAEKLAKSGQLDTFDDYLNPADFVEIDWRSDVVEVNDAETLGYGEAKVFNPA